MRYLALLFATACGTVPESGLHYDSVRARLSEASTSLYVHDEASFGTVTARRRDHDAVTTDLAIQHGYIRVALDDSGRLAIGELEIAVAPITTVLASGKPARLQDIGARLVVPARGDVTWASDDEATATIAMVFDVGGALALDGGTPKPLATQRLRPQSVDITLDGTGDHIDASLRLDAIGELWTWADGVEITEITLSLGAETAN